LPIVCLDRPPGGVTVDSVCVEDPATAEMGVAHLIEQGHTKIEILTGELTLKNEQARLQGYRIAFEKAGYPSTPSLSGKRVYGRKTPLKFAVKT
jgi:LacI family transcriptional regulator